MAIAGLDFDLIPKRKRMRCLVRYPRSKIHINPPVQMPETTFTAELPDGSFQPCYSPSTVVKKYFKMGQQLPADEFIRLSRIALTEASELVRERIGFSSTAVYSSLSEIERWAGALPPDTPVTISHVT